ncbi:hypothetical protein VNI00_003465 [Paramarasmius palmivorus]|uniref:BD-FAE-like domain-containing protein n=1 Tax=Paramarasmius palmivorus TaxID=297713 RepID=A0AAW0DSX2_9AGAR
MSVQKDIPYHSESGRNPYREFDLYSPSSGEASNLPLVCFVHGGAWRSEDKADHADLAQKLVQSTGFPVVVPNYRLTPKNKEDGTLHHPAHAEDILMLLDFLLSSWETSNALYDRSRIYLIGHSCSAHMLASIILDSSRVSPSLTPADKILAAVRGVILSEGIYDLEALVSRFPDYDGWFIEPAFGSSHPYTDLSVSHLALRTEGEIRWFIIHSKGDMLVDMGQSESMASHLKAIAGAERVTESIGKLDDEHDDILRNEEYIRMVARFVLEDSQGRN